MAQQLVTHVGAIAAGAVAAFDVAGRRIAVANVGGTLFAFDDACTHRHCSLAKGRLSGTTVTCLCHGSDARFFPLHNSACGFWTVWSQAISLTISRLLFGLWGHSISPRWSRA